MYNKANEVTRVENFSGANLLGRYTYAYSADGNRIGEKQDGGAEKSYRYDAAGRLSYETFKDGDTDIRYSYYYDANGNRAMMGANGDENYDVTYTYDKNNRLTKQVKTEVNQETETVYSYDKNGNRTSKLERIYAADTDAQMGLETKSEMAAVYEYDSRNRLQKAYTNSGITQYSYTSDGLRREKKTATATINYIWNGTNLAAETSGDDFTNYVYDVTGIAAKRQNGRYTVYLKNAHGDVVGAVDESGTLLQEQNYTAFGIGTQNAIEPFGYSGEYTDAETGLVYLRNRYYEPETGRFLTEDPAQDGMNWYIYCNNNPIMFIDPFGMARRYVRSTEGLNFRESAGLGGNVIQALSYGTEVEYTGEKKWIDGYCWAKIEHNENIGWVAAKYLRISDPNKNYIFGQGNSDVANMMYGDHPISYNGCELVAIYNALVDIGQPKEFSKIISDAESTKGVSWNVIFDKAGFGTTKDGVEILLKNYGRKVTTVTDSNEYQGLLYSGGRYIVSYWNGRSYASSIHTVMFTYENDGSIRVFNDYAYDQDARSYSSLQDYLSRQGGNSRILYNIE